MTGEDLVRAICATFNGKNRPEECKVEFVAKPKARHWIQDWKTYYCDAVKDIKWKPLHCQKTFGKSEGLADAAIDFVAPQPTYSRGRMRTIILMVVLVNLVIAYMFRRH